MSDYRNADRATRLAIATDNCTLADLLAQLATDEDSQVRQAVASNPNTPQDILVKLGKEFPEAIVANPIFTILLLENPESQFFRLSLARSSTTSPDTLANLAQIPDEEILCAIALNPNTLVSTLEQLVQNPPQIRDYEESEGEELDRLFTCIAKNPNTPESLLIELADRSSSGTQYAIAENPNAPTAVLEKLAGWRNITMHQAILRNPNVPEVVLEKLAGEQSKEIRNLVKAHPNASEMAIAIVEFMEDKPGTPIHLLEKFANHTSFHVRQLVAEHPHTPPHILELLSLDFPLQVAENPNKSNIALERAVKSLATKLQQGWRSPEKPYYVDQQLIKALIERDDITADTLDTLFSMANHQTIYDMQRFATTPPNMLLKLTKCEARSQNKFGWGNIAKNPNIPAEALEIIFSTLDGVKYSNSVFIDIAKHPNTPVQLLEELAKHPDLHQALSRNPNNPVRLLEELAKHPDLRASVCKHPNVPIELLRQLANVPENIDPWLIANIAYNENTPVDLLLRFAISPNFRTRQGLAGNTKAPVSILETLVNDEDVFVRIALAKNPSVPVSSLTHLANDPDDRVCKSLLENSNIPAQLLELFIDAADEKVRCAVAKHPNVSIDSLIRLAGDPDGGVRETILERPDLTGMMLEKLAETTFAQAVKSCSYDEIFHPIKIGRHPQTPIHILEMMANNQPSSLYQRFGDSLWAVREAVAENVNTPVSILEKLAEDCDPRVKATAKKMLKAKWRY